MGEAKRRGTYEERVKQAKKEGRGWLTNGMEMSMAQFHYKSNTDDGVMFVLDHRIPAKLITGLIGAIHTTVKKLKSEIDRDDYSQFPGVNNRQEAFAWYKDQLKQHIPLFNQIVYGQPTHPKGIVEARYNFTDKKFANSVIVVAGNIWLLTQYGQIPNNEFNGTAFSYKPIKNVA
jgi:hypothetical protein